MNDDGETKRYVVDKRRIRLEDCLKSTYIPFLGGRPDRDTIISSDDIANIKISLALTPSTQEFIQQV